jgi:small subunit ribosomal protein S9
VTLVSDPSVWGTGPLDVTETASSLDVAVSVHGGGITGQAGAVSLGLARALKNDNENLEAALRECGLLTRDSRKIERKKYGLRKARRATQYSKR